MKRSFRFSALLGTSLVSLCIAVTYIDAKTEFIGNRYSAIVLASILGVLLSFIGFLGWATQVNRKRRVLMAVLVFFYPAVAICIGIPIVGKSEPGILLHGVGALFLPAFCLALVLAGMAAAYRA